MSVDNRFAGLLGPWPPSGPFPTPQPDPLQGQPQGLLPGLPAAQPTMGLLDVPGDPASLFPPFDPMQLIAGGQGLAAPSAPLDPGGWLQALQALHASLRGPSQLTMLGADPAGGVTASASPDGAEAVRPPPTPVSSNAAAPVPTLNASDLLGFDPSQSVTHVKPSGLVQIQVPSPHAGDYPTNDAAARAMALDIPKNTPNEYATWFTKKAVPITFPDIGNGPAPFMLDRYDYPGLVTSNNPDAVLLGAPPSDVSGWGHNHPYDIMASQKTNDDNRRPSEVDNDGKPGDWSFTHIIQKTTPGFETYILGPDGILRRFHNNDQDEVDLK
jgi:hypothetical protein